jgi:hypothetical protein
MHPMCSLLPFRKIEIRRAASSYWALPELTVCPDSALRVALSIDPTYTTTGSTEFA